MGEICLSGLTGYPVQVTGWSGLLEKSELVVPNDIQLQFAPTKIPMKLDTKTGLFSVQGEHTFFMGGNQYTVRAVRIAQAKQEGLADFSGAPVAEFSIWGLLRGGSAPAPSAPALAQLCIPIRQKPEATSYGEALHAVLSGEAKTLGSLVPQGSRTDIVRYNTCVENDQGKTTTIAVAYWTSGIGMPQNMLSKLPNPLSSWGVPNLQGAKLLTSFTIQLKSKDNRRYDEQDGFLKPYQSSVALGVATPEFKNGFRLIQDFTQDAQTEQSTSAYKCIPIRRDRDIKDGKLMVDPATGRRLDEEVKQAEAEQGGTPKGGKPGAILNTVATVIGTLLGLALLALLIYFLSQALYTRKSAELPPTPEGVAKLAAVLKNAAGT